MKTANKHKESVLAFYQAIEEMNTDALVRLFSEDCIHENPYSSDILPEGAIGKEGIRAYWTPVFESFKAVNMSIEEIYAMEDPAIVYVKAQGKVILKDGPDYNNEYFMIFKFDKEGKIRHYTEVFNPIVALKSFNLLDQLKTDE
ncbi:nuclear transport factor 2 family protein [Marinifilum caeruleilacunae]|uniref:Nuclear transport factor 2 family protein n=1 Tax=Marinifilum caeruleilacunae TaxID=2499076 RepID=A0ABX1WQP2_9BACT|nr:nuclear transport factor 2 family protein [Marinifilum caeruleilacunae]NOU58295.1 nuclear transport factor 2 family protein [Marinifilum caeruleilacunae]